MTHPRPNSELRMEPIGWRRQIRVPVPDDLHETIRACAARLDTSIAEIMRVAVIDWMAANAKHEGGKP